MAEDLISDAKLMCNILERFMTSGHKVEMGELMVKHL